MEAVIAMVVVGVVVLALFGGMAYATFGVRLSRENQRATQILVEKLEAIRTYNWDQINTTGFIPLNFTAPYSSIGTTNPTSGGLVYTGAVVFAAIPTGGQNYTNDLRLVTINLSWTSGGLARNRQLSTYVARYGIQNYLFD